MEHPKGLQSNGRSPGMPENIRPGDNVINFFSVIGIKPVIIIGNYVSNGVITLKKVL